MQQGTKKSAFSARLNELLDEAGVPNKFEGRQVVVGKMFGVTQKGARKWLEGEGLPTLEKCIEIAERFGVHTEWLLSGRGPKWISGSPPENLIDILPEEARQETLSFLEFKGTKVLEGERLMRYLAWVDRMKRNPPPKNPPGANPPGPPKG